MGTRHLGDRWKASDGTEVDRAMAALAAALTDAATERQTLRAWLVTACIRAYFSAP
jgi:hypothetical protein